MYILILNVSFYTNHSRTNTRIDHPSLNMYTVSFPKCATAQTSKTGRLYGSVLTKPITGDLECPVKTGTPWAPTYVSADAHAGSPVRLGPKITCATTYHAPCSLPCAEDHCIALNYELQDGDSLPLWAHASSACTAYHWQALRPSPQLASLAMSSAAAESLRGQDTQLVGVGRVTIPAPQLPACHGFWDDPAQPRLGPDEAARPLVSLTLKRSDGMGLGTRESTVECGLEYRGNVERYWVTASLGRLSIPRLLPVQGPERRAGGQALDNFINGRCSLRFSASSATSRVSSGSRS